MTAVTVSRARTAVAATGLYASLVASLACGTPSFRHRTSWEDEQEKVLRERAAFDLQCDKSLLETRELGNARTKGVAGCGRRAVYVYDYGHDAWLMNGVIDTEQAAGPGATDTTHSPSAAPRADSSGNPGGTTL
jgi:hypothetical protein